MTNLEPAKLAEALRSFAICKDSDYENGGCEGYDMIMQAADAIEDMEYALLLMILQYCTTDGCGSLFNSFMTAGEKAFSVLGLENGMPEAPLWERIDQIEKLKEKTK